MWSQLLIKRLAVALTASQILTQPGPPKTSFDPEKDQAEVLHIMNAGCLRMMSDLGSEFPDFKKLDVDQFLEGLISTMPGQTDLTEVRDAYRVFCKNESSNAKTEIEALIQFYDQSVQNLPDPARLKDLHLPEAISVRDASGHAFTEVYPESGRRRFVRLNEIPDVVKAFVAAEDKRFYQHHGIDERGLLRAAMSNLNGGHEGGSTITQQVVKILLVGDNQTFERKIREMIVASQLERILTKDQILEVYS